MSMHNQQDDLKLIKGIGLGIERRLQKAGITSIASLAKQTPETLTDLIGRPPIRPTVMQVWIQEARRLTAKPSKKSGVRNSLSTSNRQRYANFTLEILLDKANRVRRTRMVHVQSGEKTQWTSWNIIGVASFITDTAQAKLPPLPKGDTIQADRKPPASQQTAKAAHPMKLPAASQESSQGDDKYDASFSIAVNQIKLNPQESQLQLHGVLQLTGSGAPTIAAQEPKFVIEVLALNLFTSQVIVMDTCEGMLKANQVEYPISAEIPLPHVGRYQLEIIALLPNEDVVTIKLGPFLTVLP